MFLKRIQLEGFKSFADKTHISFPSNGLVGFVGPNGVGKSNVNDAIKWVLGEQSIKSLRGANMSDVIFSGSEDRPPSKTCKVELFFDNSEKILNSNFSEVSVKRVIDRTKNENEYYINGTKCRLKDIRMLMMNTGLGKNSFTIISQGTISQLADSKPIDRRFIFEEAAGVSLYKSQKLESERKLERATQNLNIVAMTVNELKKQMKPLQAQSEKAKKFLDKKKILENYEIGLIAEELKYDVKENDRLSSEIKKMEIERNLNTNLIEQNHKRISSLTKDIEGIEAKINSGEKSQREIQNKITSLANTQNSINAEGIENIESIEEALKTLNIEKLNIEKWINTEEETINKVKDESEKISEQISNLNDELENLKINLFKLNFSRDELESKEKDKNHLFSASSAIIKNKTIFNGVIDLINNLFTTDKKYEVSIENALSLVKLQGIVLKKNKEIINIINYLENQDLGRALFFPMDKIDEREIDEKTNVILKNQNGFIGIAENLIKYDKKYKKIFSHLLGNILIFETYEDALRCFELISHKYKIVTLKGEVFNPGFTVIGGSQTLSHHLVNLESNLKEVKKNISDANSKKDALVIDIEKLESKKYEVLVSVQVKERDKIRFEERKLFINSKFDDLNNKYKSITGKYYDVGEVKGKKLDSTDSSNLNNKLAKINSELEIMQNVRKKYQSEYQTITTQNTRLNSTLIDEMNVLTDMKLNKGDLENRINQNLMILNTDYKMTIDSIKGYKWKFKQSKEEVVEIVREVREEIKELGYVNIDALSQYEELKKRYDELDVNYQDLLLAKENVNKSIVILDKKMKSSLEETVEKIRKEFITTSKELFKGGTVNLHWEDPEDILNSGIEIEAKLPGKGIIPITLLSGGEKSILAIALIFSIFKISNMPLLILDEAEASLDEANVERYAQYCLKLNKISQVLLVTHRPGTMERCDLLYGITMEKKGITKLISIRLEQAKKLVE